MRRILVFAAVLALLITVPSFAATRSWTGAVDNLWSSEGNWSDGVVPSAGDQLDFPTGALHRSNTNDLPAGLMFQSMVVQGQITAGFGYTIGGNAIGLSSGLVVPSGGNLTLNAPLRLGGQQTIDIQSASFAVLNGPIDLNGFDLTIKGYATPINGVISGSGNVRLYGTQVILNGNNTYTGTTTIDTEAGINGAQAQSDVTVSALIGQMFGAGGALGNLVVNGKLAPGAGSPCCSSTNGVGILSTRNLTFNSGSLFSNIEINGVAPGSGYDQIKVTGTVTIGANVQIDNLSATFPPSAGQVFTLIDNDGTDPVSGTFSNMPEGATVTLNGLPFRFSYVGGDGNDVTVTCVPGPKSWTGAVNDLWSNGGNWSDGVAPLAGDQLNFPTGALHRSNTNDLPASLMFQSMVVQGQVTAGFGYTIGGNAIGLTSGLVVPSGGNLTLNAPLRLGGQQTIDIQSASFAVLNGPIDLNGFDLTIKGYATPINGVISGSGNVRLYGTQVVLNGNNSYTGTTTIDTEAGINGAQPQSDVTVSTFGQLFGAGGSVGNLIVNGKLAPGAGSPCCGANGVGILSTRNLTFNSGSLFVPDITGALPGSGYDQLNVTGTVTIGANVQLANLNITFSPSPGQVFTLIDNDGTDPVSGTFSNMPEGATVTLNGLPFRFSYVGGDGNDVVLTALKETTAAQSQSAGTTKFGEPFTLTTTVTGQSGTPTGSVMFASDGVTIGTAPLQNGVATLSVTTLVPGTHAIVATFLGTGIFGDSVSASMTHVITRGQTKTSIASNQQNVVYGQTVRFTATVSVQAPAAGQPAGTVIVLADGVLLGTVPVVNGAAAVDTSVLHPGVKSITATYSGDANFDGSNAPAMQQNVAKAQTEIDARSRSAVLVGQSPLITVFVNVTPGSALVPSGIVSISKGGVTLGTQALIGGAANFSLNPLPAGDHLFIVNYGGDADFEASSASVVQSVITPALSINGTRVVEGNRGVTNVSLVISLSAAVAETVRVSFSTLSGTATAGEDYESASGVVEFAPGELTHAIELHVFGDTNPEADETFSVLLSAPINATIDTNSTVVVIANDDQVPPRRRPSGH